MMNRSKRMLLGILGLLLLMGVGTVAALDSDGPGDTSKTLASIGTPGQAGTTAVRIDGRLSDNFEVFRRPKSPDDALPDAALRSLAQGRSTVGANVALSRRIVGNGSHALYATAANGSVCTTLVDEAGAGTGCVPDSLAVEGKSVGTTLLVDGVVVHGIVPDGVAFVDISLADSTVHAPVTRNEYAVEVDGDPTTLSYVDAGHVTTLEIPYAPPDAPVVAAK